MGYDKNRKTRKRSASFEATQREDWLVMSDYIYESPDNGATIYRRKLGEAKREVLQQPPPEPETIDNLYGEIVKIRTKLFRLERKIDTILNLSSQKDYLDAENRDIYDVLEEFQSSILDKITKQQFKNSHELSKKMRTARHGNIGEE